MSRRRAATVAFGLSAVLSGCAADRGPTPEAFVARADAICEEAEARIRSEPEPRNLDDLERRAIRARVVFRDMLADLRALDVPKGDEAKVDRIFDGLEDAIPLFRELEAAAKREDPDDVDEVGRQIDALEEELNAGAEEYGFNECGAAESDPRASDGAEAGS